MKFIILLYYKMLFVLKPLITYSVSCDCVTCDNKICNHSITDITPLLYFMTYMIIILYLLSKFKVKKIKMNEKMEKINKKEK